MTNIESVVNTIMEDMSKMSFFLPHQSSSTEEKNNTKRAKRGWTNKKSISNFDDEQSTEEKTSENYNSERRLEYKYIYMMNGKKKYWVILLEDLHISKPTGIGEDMLLNQNLTSRIYSKRKWKRFPSIRLIKYFFKNISSRFTSWRDERRRKKWLRY